MFRNIPAELQALPQWVLWRYVEVEGRQTKVPYSARNAGMASVTDSSTWATFNEAIGRASEFDGIGFVLTADDPYSIIDLDNKPHAPCTPEQLARHQKIYEMFDSYAERSTSGTGVHIVVRGHLPSGVHRDNVEVYSSGRYMVFTGDILRGGPIQDFQPLLLQLYGEMRPPSTVDLTETEALIEDRDLIEMAMHASNAAKFNALCSGDMTGYPSQSEADFALLSILTFYSRSNDQVRRLFRMSALGKREKAVKNDTYLDFALGKIRAQQPPPIDPAALVANADALVARLQATPAPTQATAPTSGYTFPPGLVGEIAAYFYRTAIRPVPEIALAGAIALTAGVCGRSYNISGSGLNQYIILLARTGSGKEGALSGMEQLVSAVRPSIPMVDQFLGPAAFASGQALVKVLNDRPCFVSVLGEFGLTLQQISDSRANSAQLMLRKVLLDLYAKSGWNRMLRSSVYSDIEKNTAIVQSPNVSILGEATQESFFDGLDSSHIAEGLIPRFSIVEYIGDRPPRNKRSGVQPSQKLTQSFIDLVTISLTTTNNNACAQVGTDDHSLAMLDDFDVEADAIMNAATHSIEVQLWNRAHLKALKLAALVAVGVNPHRPIITPELAQWAIDFTRKEIKGVAKRFQNGDVGQGDGKQYNDLKRAIESFIAGRGKAIEAVARLHKARIIPYSYLCQRLANVNSFKTDRMGATNALKKTVQSMIDSGALLEVPRATLLDKHGFSGVAYAISRDWS